MATVKVQLRSIAGTEAAAGWAGGHSIVVDRPEGKAGGTGLGFNGGQLLALSIGGCLCNDIRYASHAMAISVDEIEVDVSLSLEGDPLLATAAEVDIRVTSAASNEDVTSLLDRAKQISTICNSLRRGFPVNVRQQSR